MLLYSKLIISVKLNALLVSVDICIHFQAYLYHGNWSHEKQLGLLVLLAKYFASEMNAHKSLGEAVCRAR